MTGRSLPRLTRALLLLPALGLVVGFFVLPLLRMLQLSFYQSTGDLRFVRAFVFDNYVKFLTDSYYLKIFWTSFLLALAVTLVAAILGYPLAYLMARKGRRLRTALMALLVTAIWVPLIVTVYGSFLALSNSGLVNWVLLHSGLIGSPVKLTHSFWTIVAGMTSWSVPYMALPLYAVIRSLDPSLEEASRALGAGPARAFLEVTLPLSLPGLASGTVLVWTWAIGEYVAPVILGGGAVRVMSQELAVSFLQRIDWPFGAAVCIILLVPIGAVVGLLGRYLSKGGSLL